MHRFNLFVLAVLMAFMAVPLLKDPDAIEQWYGAGIMLLTMGLMALVWRHFFQKNNALKQLWALPTLFWIINEDVYAMDRCKLPEYMMGACALASVWPLLLSVGKRPTDQILFQGAAATLIAGAAWINGPTGLFPLAFYMVYYGVFRPPGGIGRAVAETAVLSACTALCFALLQSQSETRLAIETYVQKRFLPALPATCFETTLRPGLFVIGRFFETHTPALVAAALWQWYYQRRRKTAYTALSNDWAHWALGMGAAALLPVVVSAQQAARHIIQATPFFALALAAFTAPGVFHWLASRGQGSEKAVKGKY